MSNAQANVPAESDILCERCGYALNGLPAGANCPECGKPAAESSPALRHAPAWEARNKPALSTFLSTTAEVLFHPARFYRTLATRLPRRGSHAFALIHWAFVSVVLGVAAYVHFAAILVLPRARGFWSPAFRMPLLTMAALSAFIYVSLEGITRIAARLTSFEASYRGLRLPLRAVLRGMDYHAAHYVPVAVLTSTTILGYAWLLDRRWTDYGSTPNYLYVLCGEVVVAASYLFWTYWIGMRNMMYANA